MSTGRANWYLIHAKPRQESLADENLRRQGYQTYLPLIRVWRRRRGRNVELIEPMFPRYLFIHLTESVDDFGPIRSTYGVSNLVRFGQDPARVPDDLIAAIRAHEDEQGVHPHPEPQLKAGDRVRLLAGPMAGYEAIFQARSGQERVLLLIEIAGKLAKMKVSAHHIERA